MTYVSPHIPDKTEEPVAVPEADPSVNQILLVQLEIERITRQLRAALHDPAVQLYDFSQTVMCHAQLMIQLKEMQDRVAEGEPLDPARQT